MVLILQAQILSLQRLVELGVQPLHDVGGRAGGCGQAEPGHGLEARKAALGDGGHIGHVRHALRRRHRQRPHLAVAHVADQRGHRRQVHVDLPADQVVRRLRGPFVRNVGELDAGRVLQLHGRQVGHGPVARACEVKRARLCLGGSDHVLERLERRGGRHDDHQRRVRNQANGGKVFFRVVGQLGVQRRVDRQVAGLAQHQGVAVRRGFGHGVHPDVAARTWPVLGDDVPAGVGAHLDRRLAGQHVGAAAGRERDDQADGLVGVVLSRAQAGHAHEGQAREDARERLHRLSPNRCFGGDIVDPCSTQYNAGSYSETRCVE